MEKVINTIFNCILQFITVVESLNKYHGLQKFSCI
jgi:hypothetical protein